MTQDGVMRYRVHWLGYDSNEDTWETVESLEGCQDLLAEFNSRRKKVWTLTRYTG